MVDRLELADRLADIGKAKAAWRVRACGEYYIPLECMGCGKVVGVKFTCNVRVCHPCARRAAKLAEKRMLGVLLFLRRVGKLRRGWSWKLLTLTTRQELSTRARVRLIKREFANLWRRFYASKGAGCFYAVEIGNGDNVHLHAVLYAPYVDRDELKAYWEERTGAYIVDIRMVSWKLHEVVAYIVKYITKEGDGDVDSLVSKFIAFYGSRRIGAKGIMYAVRVIESKESVCPFCLDAVGWVVPVPFRFVLESCAQPLTRVRWVIDFW